MPLAPTLLPALYTCALALSLTCASTSACTQPKAQHSTETPAAKADAAIGVAGSTADSALNTDPNADSAGRASTPASSSTDKVNDELTECVLGGWLAPELGAFTRLEPWSILPLIGTAQVSLRIELGLAAQNPDEIQSFSCEVARRRGPIPAPGQDAATDFPSGGAATDSGIFDEGTTSAKDAALADADGAIPGSELGQWLPQNCSVPLEPVCDSDGWCVWAPLQVGTRELTLDPYDLDNLAVEVSVTLKSGSGRSCTSTLSGILLRKQATDAQADD